MLAIIWDKILLRHGSFELSTYQEKRAYEYIRGDVADTGYEHVLYDEDGREICKFGGLSPEVTSGSCDIAEINFVRKLPL